MIKIESLTANAKKNYFIAKLNSSQDKQTLNFFTDALIKYNDDHGILSINDDYCFQVDHVEIILR